MKLKKQIKGKGKTAIVFFHYWKGGGWGTRLFKLLYPGLRKKYTCIYYSYTRDIISADVEGTKQNFLRIMEDAQNSIKPFKEVYVIGASLGSSLGHLLASREPKITKLVMFTSGLSLPFAIWYGRHLENIAARMKANGITLIELAKAWIQIDPKTNEPKGKQILLYYSTYDGTIVPVNVRKHIKQLKVNNELTAIPINAGHQGAALRGMLHRRQVYDFINS